MTLTAEDLDKATATANAGGNDTSSAGLLNVAQGVQKAYAKPEPVPVSGEATSAGVSALHDEPHDVREDDPIEALKVGTYQFANQGLFGVPQIIADHVLDKKTLKDYEDMRDRHPLANYGGGAAGFVGSLFIGGPLFKAASKAGTLAHGLVLGAEAGEDVARAADVTHALAEVANPVTHTVGEGSHAAALASEALPKAASSLGDLGGKAMAAAHDAVTEHLADALGGVTKASPDIISQALLKGDPGAVAKIAEAAARTAAPGLGKKVLAKAVQYGVEGAVLSAPQTLANASMGDWKHAGESLAMGAGLGVALGTGLGAVSKGVDLGTEALSKLKPEDLEAALPLVAKYAIHPAKHIAGLIMGGHGNFIGAAAIHAGAPMLEDMLVNKGTAFLSRLSKNPETGQFGLEMAQSLQGYLQKSINGLQDGVTSAGVRAVPSHDPVRDVLGAEANGLSKDRQWDRMSDKLSTLDPEQHLAQVAPIFGAVPNAAKAAGDTFKQQVSYLQAQLPRAPVPAPFSNTSSDPVNASQKQAFNDKLSITLDPTRAAGHLKAGTLNQNHVEALQANYPDYYQKACASLLASPPNKNLSIQQRNQVSTFLQLPMSPSLQSLTLLSTMPSPGPDQSQGGSTHASPGKTSGKARAGGMKDMPSLQTNTQRITAGK